MGQLVQFPSNGEPGQGYLALPVAGRGPGVVVIQEWWGLVDHIKDVCERFAREGFVALAPDLYRGRVTEEPNEAEKLMMALDLERAARDMSAAVDFLASHRAVASSGIGVIGFCMGGGLALVLACQRPDRVQAAVPFYGVIPWPAAEPDWSKLAAAVQGHFAEHDESAPPAAAHALEARLRELGKDAAIFIYPDTVHGFFNDSRVEEHNPAAARQAWERTLDFLRARLR